MSSKKTRFANKFTTWCVLWTLVSVLFSACSYNATIGTADSDRDTSATPQNENSIQAKYKLDGLTFGPFIKVGEDPNLGTRISEEQLLSRVKRIEPYTKSIRSYGCSNGLEKLGGIAHGLNLTAAIGAWIGKDLQANEKEITNLINVGKAGEADWLVVGNESILRGDVSEEQLIGYIKRVKQAVPNLPVTTAEPFDIMLRHPKLMEASDEIYIIAHPFWHGLKVENGVAAVHDWYQQVVKAAKGKRVVIAESGFPFAGPANNEAVPSASNGAFYLLNLVSYCRANNITCYYFSAYSEPFKEKYEKAGSGYGLIDVNGNLRPGVQEVLDGKTMLPDNWSPRKPAVEITSASGGYLRGRVKNINPSEYKLVVLILVDGLWWSKPFANSLDTSVQSNSEFSCRVETGGRDAFANGFKVFCVPKDFKTPVVLGGSIPGSLERSAVAKAELSR